MSKKLGDRVSTSTSLNLSDAIKAGGIRFDCHIAEAFHHTRIEDFNPTIANRRQGITKRRRRGKPLDSGRYGKAIAKILGTPDGACVFHL